MASLSPVPPATRGAGVPDGSLAGVAQFDPPPLEAVADAVSGGEVSATACFGAILQLPLNLARVGSDLRSPRLELVGIEVEEPDGEQLFGGGDEDGELLSGQR